MQVTVTLKCFQKTLDVEYILIKVGAHYTNYDAISISKLIGKEFKVLDLKTGKEEDVVMDIDIHLHRDRFCVKRAYGKKANGEEIIIEEGKDITFLIREDKPDIAFVDEENLFSLYYWPDIEASKIEMNKVEKDGREDLLIKLGDGYSFYLLADKENFDKDKLLRHFNAISLRLQREIKLLMNHPETPSISAANSKKWLSHLLDFHFYLSTLL